MTLHSTLRRLAGASFAALALSSAMLSAAHAGEAEIRKNLAASIPQLANIEEVRKAPIPGMYEVRVGFDVFYTDENGNYLIQGSMLDVKNRKNLTEERVAELSALKFDQLPLKDAFKIVRGNGKRKLAVFEDPNCGYCKVFEKDLRNVNDVTVYLFLYPILGADSHTKSRDIWCAKDKAASWNAWMVDGVKPASAECDIAPLQRNVAFGRKFNITGTPTLIFADGTRAPGALPAAQVEKMLAAAN
ncbi:MAG: DsbC family protein [Comamonadaceae bacterium]|nr:MAG: DsbC family protein [Comamonadaceae bacterium]